MAPGISAARLEAMLTPRPEAVLLRAYGVGNVPSDEPGLTDVIADVLHDGVPVVIASQCQQAEVLLGITRRVMRSHAPAQLDLAI